MGAIERQTTVSAPDVKVFNYLVDVSNHSQWAAHNLEVHSKPDGPVQVGSAFETVGHQFGEQPGTVTIMEMVPNERIVYESDGPVGHFRHGFIIKDNGDGTVLLTKTMEPLEVKNLPLKILGPVVRNFIAPKGLDGDLQRIKEKLETA
jgi:uncharacterized protein YndB with AHSA1/START domain